MISSKFSSPAVNSAESSAKSSLENSSGGLFREPDRQNGFYPMFMVVASADIPTNRKHSEGESPDGEARGVVNFSPRFCIRIVMILHLKGMLIAL
jgi:hypothetical protein